MYGAAKITKVLESKWNSNLSEADVANLLRNLLNNEYDDIMDGDTNRKSCKLYSLRLSKADDSTQETEHVAIKELTT